MGKKFRKKNQIKNCVSPAKERNKIRDSILQVFRARLQSPGKGGALLVGKSGESLLFLDNNRNRKSRTFHLSSSSSDIDSDSSNDYLMAKKKKVRCKRKTTKETSPKTLDTIKKHIKPRTEMSSSVPEPGTSSEQKISLITQSRVTKCLGLFNRGRKSDRIARVPISMSESVQNKTNEDLKRVLNIKNTSDNDCSEGDSGNYSNMAPKKSSPLILLKQNNCRGSKKRNSSQTTVTQKIPSSANSMHEPLSSASCVTVSSNVSSCSDRKENMPKIAPVKEIATEMLSNLQPKRVLFNRDIRRERFNELQRLLMQSLQSSSPCSSTENTKPTAMISAKRSLISSASVPSQDSVEVDNNNRTEIQEKKMNLSGFNDAKSLLIQNDFLMKLEKNPPRKSVTASIGKSSEIDVSFQNLNEVAFTSNFDNPRSKPPELNMGPHCDQQQLIGHTGDFAQLNTDKLKFMTCKKFLHYQQMDQHKSNVSSCIIVTDEPDFRESREAAPGFSGDFAGPIESSIKRKQIYQTEDSLDFLEYLDQNSSKTDVSSSFWDSHHQNLYTWNKTILKEQDSDSENSPLWVPLSNLPPPPTKPCLDSIPSPPENLYPRKLY